MPSKTCRQCGRTLDLSEFHRHARGGQGVRSNCKACRKEEQRNGSKDRYQQNRERQIEAATRSNLRTRYGLDEFEIDFVLTARFCEMCGEERGGRRLHVDHDHVTGEVRWLLCNSCNLLLGHARDDVQRLQMAMDWLTKH